MYDSPFGFAEMFGMTFAMILWIPYLMVFLFLPVVLYVMARWRQAKAGIADDHLGIKCGFGLFRVISLQLVLSGLWLFIYSLLADGDNEVLTRTAFGVMLPGGMILGAVTGLLARTNNAHMPMPYRLFRGWEMVQTGLAASLALVVAFVVTVQEDPPDELLEAMWSMVAVYGAAWGLMLRSFLDKGVVPESVQAVHVGSSRGAVGSSTEPPAQAS